MQLYKHILIAIDCSPVDDVILKHGSALALQNNAEVTLLHVVHSHTIDQDRVLREAAEILLDKHCKSFIAQGIQTQVVIRTGEPDEQILDEVDKGYCDLVAMATHGHSFIGDLLFGSVSRTLKHKISIPLLLIGPPRTGAVPK